MDHGVGKTLREARRQRGVGLAEVVASTRIRSRFLRALENEEWEALPGEAYARGFIRAYAGYLGLDGARLAEEHRRDIGAERPGERLLGDGLAQGSRRGRSRLRRRAPALLVSALLVAALVAVGLGSGDDQGPASPEHPLRRADGRNAGEAPPPRPRPRPGLSLRMAASAEVWVCLLNAGGEPLVDGRILGPGAEAGPFRSGSFTVSLGNGEVSMMVNGQQASIPATPSPIGYAIDAGGALRELSAGERPTCT